MCSYYVLSLQTRGQEVCAVVMSLAILFTMIVTPFEVAFLSSTPHADGLFVVNRILDILFLAVSSGDIARGYPGTYPPFEFV